MAEGKKVVINTPFKDAIAKKSGGLGSPASQDAYAKKSK